MKKTFQFSLLTLAALALSMNLALAEGKCGEKKCNTDKKETKCATDKKGMKCESGKCASDKTSKKEVKSKEKCGQSKCG